MEFLLVRLVKIENRNDITDDQGKIIGMEAKFRFIEDRNVIIGGKIQGKINQIIELEMEQEIFRSIENLNPRCRDIFIMSRIDGKRNGQIADELSISIRTVETQISNALKEIRNHIRHYLA